MTSLVCTKTTGILGKVTLEVEKTQTLDGDSLVPCWSATLGKEGDDIVMIEENKYGENVGHTAVLWECTDDILDLVKG